MMYIAYFTELSLQICDYAQNYDYAKIVNTRLTKIFMAIFSPDERLPSSAALTKCIVLSNLINHVRSYIREVVMQVNGKYKNTGKRQSFGEIVITGPGKGRAYRNLINALNIQ